MTVAVRVIPCLDVDGGRVVKGVNFRELRDAGDPVELAAFYDAEGADELTFLDITASSGGRDTMYDVVRRTAEQVFIPLTVGGGVRSVADVDRLLRAGADKVSLNTAAVARPELLDEAAQRFGSQCVVLSVDARRAVGPALAGGHGGIVPPGQHSGFEVTTHGGRTGTGIDAVAWAQRAVQLGAGEILLNSMDADGTAVGFDLELIRAVRAAVTVPVIASGGAGALAHFAPAVDAGADAVLAASVFHFGTLRIAQVKNALRGAGHPVRLPGASHRGADDPGVVLQGRGHDAGPDARQPRHPFVGLPADAAAHDEQARRDYSLDVLQVLIHASRPLAPAQVVQLLGSLGGALLGVLTVQLDVPELGVRHQDALGEQRAADPGAEGQHQHRARLAHPGAERHLGHPGRVGVVQHPDRVADGPAEHRGGVQADPGRVHVGRGPGHPVDDHAGKGDAHRAGPAERGDEFLHHARHRVGQGRARGVDLLPVGQQLARGHIDRGRLDAGTADVNPEYVHGHRVFVSLGGTRPVR
jgi:imidazole glycerol-phosphate synthase subunit HisF